MTKNRIFMVTAATILIAVALVPIYAQDTPDPTVDAIVQSRFTQTAEASAQIPAATQTANFDATVDAAFNEAIQATNAAATAQAQPATPTPRPTTVATTAPPVDTNVGPVIQPASALALSTALVLDGHTAPLNGIAISADNRFIATASADSTVRVWNAANGALLQTLEHDAPVLDVIFNPANNQLVSGDANGTTYLWRIPNGESLSLENERPMGNNSAGMLPVAMGVGGGAFATFDLSGTLYVWSPQNRTPTVIGRNYTFALPYIQGEASVLAFATQTEPGLLQVRSLFDEEMLWAFESGADSIEPVAFSSDGTLLLATDSDGTNFVLDVNDGEAALEFPAFGFGLAAFGPAASTIAEGSRQGTIHLLNAADGEELATLSGHRGAVNDIAFSSDGTFMVSASTDQTARIWRTGVDEPQTVAEAGGPTPLPEGFPDVTQAEVQVAEQVFEGGRMFWVQPVNQIWVLIVDEEGSGDWQIYPDTFTEGEPEVDPNLEVPEGRIQPERGFGKLWRENPDVQDALGWAITPEFGYQSLYRYVPGGEIIDGEYVMGPGVHVLFSLNSEEFRFNEASGTWQLGS